MFSAGRSLGARCSLAVWPARTHARPSRLAGCLAALTLATLAFIAPASAQVISAQDYTTDPMWPIDERGDGCSSPTWPKAPAADDVRRVLVIGDSMIRDSRTMLEPALTKAGWLPTVRCWGAKGSLWGAEQVQRAKALDQFPDTVVVSLGVNDIWWLHIPMDQSVDILMHAIGSHHTVYWINLFFGPNGYNDLPRASAANNVLRLKARTYPNLHIINFARDYRAALQSDSSVGWADGVHLNEAGYRVRTRIIVEALGSPPSRGPAKPTPKPAGDSAGPTS